MIRALLITLTIALLAGCSSFSDRIQDLDFGMTEGQVRDELGSDYQVVASSINKEGQKVAGWKYQDSEKDPAYMVYFVDGKLAQWGEAGALRAIPELGNPDHGSESK
ncbi:MAG: hypothetical protein AAFX93_07700 [Verrucomicrobiota bacterium]